MSLQDLIAYVVLSAAETYVFHMFFKALLRRNERHDAIYAGGLVVYYVFQFVSYVLQSPLFSMAPLYMAFALLTVFHFYHGSNQVRGAAAFAFVLLNYVCKVLAVALTSALSRRYLPDIPLRLVMGHFDQILSCCFVAAASFVITQLRSVKNRRINWLSNSILCIVTVANSLLVLWLFWNHGAAVDNLHIYVEAALLLLCTTLFLFFFIEKAQQINTHYYRTEMLHQQLEMQSRYYEQMETHQREIQAIRHDIQNHMLYIMSMIEKGESGAALEYAEKLHTRIVSARHNRFCRNSVADVLLNAKYAEIRADGIILNARVDLPASLPMDNLDLCILLGNLLDNAIEACKRIEDADALRTISVRSGIKGTNLLLSISNSYNGVLRQNGGRYESLKKNRRVSGLGLFNVRDVVERHHGTMDIQHDENRFSISILLRLRESA